MSAVVITRRKSNLSKMIAEAGGMTVLSALKAADRETAGLRDEGRAILDEAIAALEAVTAAPGRDATWLDQVYSAASAVLDVCPPDLLGMAKAAFSLCELTDLQRRNGRNEPAPVEVHVQSVRLLAQPGLPEAAIGPILEGLDRLLTREAAQNSPLPDAG